MESWFCSSVMNNLVWVDSPLEMEVVILRFHTFLEKIEESLVKKW